MKIDGSFTIRFNKDGAKIMFHDSDASITFAEIKVSPEDMLDAMGGLAYSPCEMKVYNLDKVGKKMEHKKFEFQIPENLSYSNKSEVLAELAKTLVPEGWVADGHFSSQGSFFKIDEVQYARCTIRRWVDFTQTHIGEDNKDE